MLAQFFVYARVKVSPSATSEWHPSPASVVIMYGATEAFNSVRNGYHSVARMHAFAREASLCMCIKDDCRLYRSNMKTTCESKSNGLSVTTLLIQAFFKVDTSGLATQAIDIRPIRSIIREPCLRPPPDDTSQGPGSLRCRPLCTMRTRLSLGWAAPVPRHVFVRSYLLWRMFLCQR
jgi:hypothetical protein